MEKTDVYNMRVVPLMRKINIVKDGKTKSIVEENISMNEIRNMSCEPRMLIRKDDDVYYILVVWTSRNNTTSLQFYENSFSVMRLTFSSI